MARDQRSGPHTKPCGTSEARRHLNKAQQYLRSANEALDRNDHDAAAGKAVLAGINAADAVSGIVNGDRCDGPHEGAAKHVDKAGQDGKAVSLQLRKLVRKKTQAHYQAGPVAPKEAQDLVQAGARAVAAAERTVERHVG